MAVSRFSTSRLGAGLPKYQKFWDGTSSTAMGGVDRTGLHSWYDASVSSSITSSAGTVIQWNDLSGNNRHASQASSSYRPVIGVNTQNSKNVIIFDGIQQYLQADASITSNALTIFSVYKRYTNAGANSTYGRVFSLFNTSGNDYSTTDAIEVHATSASFNSITPPLVGVYRNSAQAAGNTISYNTPYLFSATLNGTAVSQNNSGTVTTGTTDATNLNVNKNTLGAGGNSGGGDAYFTGWFAEQIIFTRVLSSTEITAVRNYLSSKWSV